MHTISKRQIPFEDYQKETEQKLNNSKDSSLKKRLIYGNFLNSPVEENQIFYESQQGSGILGLPKNIFLAALQEPNLTHIWSVLKDTHKEMKDELKYFRIFGNVRIVIRGSNEYYQHLATSKYLVTDSFFTSDFYKRPEQILLWTGRDKSFCLKGYDKGIFIKPNEQYSIRHCFQADILLSPNQEETNNIYFQAYKLLPLFGGSIMEYGSLPYHCSDEQKYLSFKKIIPFLNNHHKDNILISPETYHCTKEELKNTAQYYSELIQEIRQDQRSSEFNILFSVTRNAYSVFSEFPEIKDFIIPLHCDIRDISKYISCFVTDSNPLFQDFSEAGVPVAFLKALYPDQLYHDIPDCLELKDLCSLILNNKYETLPCTPRPVKYSADNIWKSFYASTQMHDTMSSCKKKKLVFFTNFSNKNDFYNLDLLNIINCIDFTHFDVTLICPFISKKNSLILNSINPHIRFLELNGGVPYSQKEYIQYDYLAKFLMNADNVLETLSPGHDYMNLFQKNLSRVLSDAHFDFAYYYGPLNNIDYLIFHTIKSAKKFFIRYDSQKEEKDFFTASDDRKFLFQNRCRIYDSFDKIFCVSEELLLECKKTLPNLYKNSCYLPRFPQKNMTLNIAVNAEEVKYNDRSYLILDKMLTKDHHTTVSLVPIPYSKKSSYLFILSNFSEEEFMNLLNAIQKCIIKNPLFEFFIIDNYNYIKEAKKYIPLLSSLEDNVIIIKNYIPTQNYISFFEGILSLEPEKTTDYNVILSMIVKSPLFSFERTGTLCYTPLTFKNSINTIRKELQTLFF